MIRPVPRLPKAECERARQADRRIRTGDQARGGSIQRVSAGAARQSRCSGRWRSVRSSRWAMCMERFAALRRERVIPHEFADRFLERLSSGKLDRERALELCRAHESPAARVFAMVVDAWGQPGVTIRQIVSHDAAGEVVELKRNLRVLSAMSTLGPLLGLLGTVVGIIQSFDALGGRLGPAEAKPWPTASAWPWSRRLSAWRSRSSRSRFTTSS